MGIYEFLRCTFIHCRSTVEEFAKLGRNPVRGHRHRDLRNIGALSFFFRDCRMKKLRTKIFRGMKFAKMGLSKSECDLILIVEHSPLTSPGDIFEKTGSLSGGEACFSPTLLVSFSLTRGIFLSRTWEVITSAFSLGFSKCAHWRNWFQRVNVVFSLN